jgi:hypothetical protein
MFRPLLPSIHIIYLWPDDGLMIEAETCCHLVTLNKINIQNTSYVLTCESLLLTCIPKILILFIASNTCFFLIKQDMQRNTTQHRDAFVQPLLQWKKSNKYYIFWLCVCSLRYPTCKAHSPYCHLWPARLYNIFIFIFLSHKRHDFRKQKTIDNKNMFWFSLQLLSEIFLILRRI